MDINDVKVIDALRQYDKLLNKEYEVVYARKQATTVIKIKFDKYDWFHAMGMHYLTDIFSRPILRKYSLPKLYDKILDETDTEITEEHFQKSLHFKEAERGRVYAISNLEYILDNLGSADIRFQTFDKSRAYGNCSINANYYISDDRDAVLRLNLFLVKTDSVENKKDDSPVYIVDTMSMFVQNKKDITNNTNKDYRYNQVYYAILKNTKIEYDDNRKEVSRKVLFSRNSNK